MVKIGKILTGLALISSLAFSPKVKGQEYIVNPFVQPNKIDLNWYGSGDVNHDNTVNWDDVSSMNSIIDGSLVPNLESDNPIEYRTLDRADVDGNGTVNNSDKKILEDKLNGSIPYLPGEWNKLETKEERESWLGKMIEIDKTDTMSYLPDGYICTDFARQTMINFNGFPELGYDKEKGLRDNGRFNAPMNYASTVTTDGKGHAVNSTITEDNFEEFYDNRYTEPQNDQRVFPGMWDMDENCEVIVNSTYVNHSSTGNYLASVPIVKFQLTNGNPELTWENDDPNLKIIKQRDKTPTKINASVSLEGKLNWNIIENENFESASYRINNGEEIQIGQSGEKNLNLPEGQYEIEIKAKNYFDESDTTFNFETQPVGLEDRVSNSKIKVYPNPAEDYINFNSENGREAELEIYSVDGKKIKEDYSSNGDFNLDVTNFPSGMYLYRYGNTDGVKSGKVVVK